MKPSEDQTEDKIQKSKEIQKQVQKSTKDKEGNPQSDSPKSKKELAAERRKKQVGGTLLLFVIHIYSRL